MVNSVIHVFLVFALIVVGPAAAEDRQTLDVYVFKSVRLTENQGRLLKLTAGAFMLFFGLLMIFKPELLAFG